MSYFIGIVPPENIYNEVIKIQHKFGNNRIEPHITIRQPVVPTETDKWLFAASEVFKNLKPFNIELTKTNYFRKDVLFIGIQSKELNLLFQKLITELLPFEPVNSTFGQTFHPHLTLARKRCGFTRNDFEEMQKLADNWLIEKDRSFTANFARIYHKASSSAKFQKLRDIPFLNY